MTKCDGGETGCDGKSRNKESWCGPCVRAKRARGEKVVNRVSPSTVALTKALKKRPSDRSAHEQSECDRYGLRCVSRCTQCCCIAHVRTCDALTRAFVSVRAPWFCAQSSEPKSIGKLRTQFSTVLGKKHWPSQNSAGS